MSFSNETLRCESPFFGGGVRFCCFFGCCAASCDPSSACLSSIVVTATCCRCLCTKEDILTVSLSIAIGFPSEEALGAATLNKFWFLALQFVHWPCKSITVSVSFLWPFWGSTTQCSVAAQKEGRFICPLGQIMIMYWSCHWFFRQSLSNDSDKRFSFCWLSSSATLHFR